MKVIEHLLSYFAGLVTSTLDDYTLITLGVASAFASLVYGILRGFLFYFTGYFILRLVGNIADAIGFAGRVASQRQGL